MRVKFNKNYSTIIINEIEIELSREQYNLLHYIAHSEKIVPKSELKIVLEDEWRSDDCLKTAICSINTLIRQYTGRRIIFNRRGIGYYVKKSLEILDI